MMTAVRVLCFCRKGTEKPFLFFVKEAIRTIIFYEVFAMMTAVRMLCFCHKVHLSMHRCSQVAELPHTQFFQWRFHKVTKKENTWEMAELLFNNSIVEMSKVLYM